MLPGFSPHWLGRRPMIPPVLMNNLRLGNGYELEARGEGLFVQAMLVADG